MPRKGNILDQQEKNLAEHQVAFKIIVRDEFGNPLLRSYDADYTYLTPSERGQRQSSRVIDYSATAKFISERPGPAAAKLDAEWRTEQLFKQVTNAFRPPYLLFRSLSTTTASASSGSSDSSSPTRAQREEHAEAGLGICKIHL
jgi:hypothetical protein